MTQENNENTHKVYAYGDSPGKVVDQFIKSLQDGITWADNTTEHWAEIKTFHLSKELILFNLGVLGFVSAMREEYHSSVLVFALLFSFFSIFLSFWFICKVAKENINSTNKRRMVMQKTLEKIFEQKELTSEIWYEINSGYNREITSIVCKTREKEKCWNLVQTGSISCFFLSMISAVVGLFPFN